MALAICVTAPLAAILLSVFVKEVPPPAETKQQPSYVEGLKRLWDNKPMRMIVGIILIVTLAEAFRNALSLFFMKSVIQAKGVGTLYFIYFVDNNIILI